MKEIIVIVAFHICIASSVLGRTKTTTTQGREQENLAKSHTSSILHLEKKDREVRIHSNGQYVRPISSSSHRRLLTNDFSITLGETFQLAPDHHASATFTLIGIRTNGIDIEYESRFDHRSFGKDLITKDVGDFFWPYSDLK